MDQTPAEPNTKKFGKSEGVWYLLSGALFKDIQTIFCKLDEITNTLNNITQKENVMATDLTAITAEIANNSTVEASVLALIQTLASEQTDPAALAALVSTLAANDQAIAAAVVANTPAAPVTPPAPPPGP